MDFKNLLSENMLLEVYDHYRQVYGKSIIQEVNRDCMAIGIPMKKKEMVALKEGVTYSFRVVLSDALYYFRSKVLGTRSNGHVILYLISWPQSVERRQRRDFFRISCALDARYLVISGYGSQEKLSLEESQAPETALVTNLSGGGLMLVTDNELPVETFLLLCLFLKRKEEKKVVLVKGKILRVYPFKVGKVVRYRYGIEFLDLEEKVRDEIIRYIFTILRERLC
jgi:c-di-GMP-binding flagellar brake protein YcgR